MATAQQRQPANVTPHDKGPPATLDWRTFHSDPAASRLNWLPFRGDTGGKVDVECRVSLGAILHDEDHLAQLPLMHFHDCLTHRGRERHDMAHAVLARACLSHVVRHHRWLAEQDAQPRLAARWDTYPHWVSRLLPTWAQPGADDRELRCFTLCLHALVDSLEHGVVPPLRGTGDEIVRLALSRDLVQLAAILSVDLDDQACRRLLGVPASLATRLWSPRAAVRQHLPIDLALQGHSRLLRSCWFDPLGQAGPPGLTFSQQGPPPGFEVRADEGTSQWLRQTAPVVLTRGVEEERTRVQPSAARWIPSTAQASTPNLQRFLQRRFPRVLLRWQPTRTAHLRTDPVHPHGLASDASSRSLLVVDIAEARVWIELSSVAWLIGLRGQAPAGPSLDAP